MTFIDFNDNNRASYGLAVEEYVMTNPLFKDEYFLLWHTNPTIVIGRYQTTLNEINSTYVKENNVSVVRRRSGGGAMYQDPNGLQFCFISWKSHQKETKTNLFRQYSAPIVEALNLMGVEVVFSGRNDLMLNNKKFSGNSQYSIGERFLHHGTLLFDSNLENLVKALNVGDEKIISKGIQSVKERVINLRPYLNNPEMSFEEFRAEITAIVSKQMPTITFTTEQIKEIEELERSKYLSWDWVYGKSPMFNIFHKKKLEGGMIEFNFNVKEGVISECSIRGDFFYTGEIEELENIFVGLRYEKEWIIEALLSNESKISCFNFITLSELVEMFK